MCQREHPTDQDCASGGHSQAGGCSEGHGECECGGYHAERRFQTKAEQIAALEGYLAELKIEAQAVEERLADLQR